MPDSVLGKTMAILHAFHPEDRALALAELVRRTGLHKATAHRLAGDLVTHGLLDRVEGGYRLSDRLFELGMLASRQRELHEMATPFLQDLYERTHETVHLGVRDGHEVVYVAKITGHRRSRAPSRAGGRMPLTCTGIGKALLAHSAPVVQREVLNAPMERRTPRTIVAPGILHRQLGKIRQTGIAFEHEESALGVTCVAAAVIGPDDEPVAAISVTGPVGRFRPQAYAHAVRTAAGAVSSLLTGVTDRYDPRC